MEHSIDARPSRRLVKAVAQAREILAVCVATGRALPMAGPIIEMLGVTDPCVISAGTRIIDPVNGHVIWERLIARRDVISILEICSSYPYEMLMRDEVIGEGLPATEREVETTNVIYLMQCDPIDAERIAHHLKKLSRIAVAIMPPWKLGDGVDIHITHREGTKAHAVAELLRMINVPKCDAIGVGDADNDIDLFKAVGRRVAMGNASLTLKNQADEICGSVDNDGLATFIESLIAQT